MSEWIPCETSKPPESHSVLLYIVFYYPDGKSMWSNNIFVGFYGDEDWDEKGFYLETIDEDSMTISYKLINESDQIKVLAWTLLPRRPYDPEFNREEWSW